MPPVQSPDPYKPAEESSSFDRQLHLSLKTLVGSLRWMQFAVNYGYAIENVWVTMLMITLGTPEEVDSFVWILPIVLAVLLRPYLVRFVHQVHRRVYRQIATISFFLGAGAVGSLIVAFSCGMAGKSRTFRRILTCTLGWTIMDLSFQFCQYFADKAAESQQELQEQLASDSNKGNSGYSSPQSKLNVELCGLLLGYSVSVMICYLVDGRTLKEFYQSCQYAFWTVAGMAGLAAMHLYAAQAYMPTAASDEDKHSALSILPISTQTSFYLPGMEELLRSDRWTLLLAMLHAAVGFVSDVVTIYATMWFSEPSDHEFSRRGESLTAGLLYGSAALMIFTVVNTLKIQYRHLQRISYFKVSLLAAAVLSLLAFCSYDYLSFYLLCGSVAVLNQFYRHSVLSQQLENNPVFERCIEVVERTQKIAVLAVMPPIVMLLMGRNDIPDCLLWSAGFCLLGLGLHVASGREEASREGLATDTDGGQTVKVSKIE